MNKKLRTSIVYTKNLFITGAIAETSRKTEIEICKYIPKGANKIIVEYGMGHGNITREILNSIDSTSKVYAFEVKKSFCEYVRKSICDERLVIINDSAENIEKYISGNIHAAIGSIPYSFLTKEKRREIIQRTYDKLTNHAYYSQVLYSKSNFKRFQLIFNYCYLKTTKNIPKGYVYHCKKELN